MTSVIWAIGIYATLFVLDFFCLRANPAPRAKVTHRQGRNLPWKHIFSSQVPAWLIGGSSATWWFCELRAALFGKGSGFGREGHLSHQPALAHSLSGNFSRCCWGITEDTKCDWSAAVQWIASPKMMLRVEEKGPWLVLLPDSPLHCTPLHWTLPNALNWTRLSQISLKYEARQQEWIWGPTKCSFSDIFKSGSTAVQMLLNACYISN